VPFPFSDLSGVKLRPALVLLDAGRGDLLMCQITGNPFGDPKAIRIAGVDLAQGTLATVSFARPLKLFTANDRLIVKRIAILGDLGFEAVLNAAIAAPQDSLPR
jgi:mRNA interferase MazF